MDDQGRLQTDYERANVIIRKYRLNPGPKGSCEKVNWNLKVLRNLEKFPHFCQYVPD